MTIVEDRAHDVEFARFLQERRAASDAFVAGDVAPLEQIAATRDPASIFPPNGVVVAGAEQVNAFNAGGAARFEAGGSNALEVLHSGASGDLGYWVGVQTSRVRIKGQDEPVPMRLRLTEVYRREAAGWRLVHRHADPAAASE